MNKFNKKVLIGVAWPYVNGDLHPGHIAGCYLAADIYARYRRLKGDNVLMISGSDCFGTPITLQADKEGKTPQEIVEYYSPRTKSLLLDVYKISFDSFYQTLNEVHQYIVKKFFLELNANGYIIRKKTIQYFSKNQKKFLPDRYVEGECSFCHAQNQRGDQCESCGKTLQVGELINPKAKLSSDEVILKETEHYFIDLSQFKTRLQEYINSKRHIWRNWVWNESSNWLNDLKERAITRDIDWGVEIPIKNLPKDMIIDNHTNKRFYVWFDAVIGYFSESFRYISLNYNLSLEEFIKNWWKNDDDTLEHYIFVGKDNLFFHTIWWPALLLGQENNLKLPDNVVVNQFLNLEGQKFSKSRGIYIDAKEIVEKYGLDAIRFYITTIMPENADSSWFKDELILKYNNELINNLGNFINRILTFAVNKLGFRNKNLNFHKLDCDNFYENYSINSLLTNNFIFKEVENAIKSMEFKKALNSILFLSKLGNIYFDRKSPWLKTTDEIEQAENTILNCIHIILAIRRLINPFLPDASNRISDLLGLDKIDSQKSSGENYWCFDIDEIKKVKINGIKPIFEKLS